MLRFTRSGDGESRASVRISFRIERKSVAYAVAYEALTSAKFTPTSWLTYIKDNYTKGRIETLIRDRYYVYGPPDQWPEQEEDSEWEECLEAAIDFVYSLWREDH